MYKLECNAASGAQTQFAAICTHEYRAMPPIPPPNMLCLLSADGVSI